MNNNTTNGLNYRVFGNGNPVLFLHGFMEDLSMWTPAVEQLEGIQAICIDLFGHGESEFDESIAPSIEYMAQKVQDIVDDLKLEHPQIVGHSLGGYVALEMMKSNPTFEHVVLLHSHPWADNEQRKKDRNRVMDMVKTRATFFISEAIPNLYAHPSQRTTEIERNSTIANRMNNKAIAWTAAAMRDRLEYVDVLIEHPEKFTFIQGKMDALIPRLPVETFAIENGISYIELGKSGHMGHEEEPAKLVDLLQMILSF